MLDQDYAPTPDQSDEYLTMKVIFPSGGVYQQVVITHRKWYLEVYLMGQRIANPLLYTRVWTTEFPDGEVINISANTAA